MTDPHSRWKMAKGDDTLALDWEIDEDSNVWEIGGFEGRWAKQISDKYDPRITIFEPTRHGYGKCSAVFIGNHKVTVNHYGLWVMDCHLPLYNPGNDGASLMTPHQRSEVCEFRDVYTELPWKVDLCLMNVEGAEFVLLPYMIANRLVEHIDQFWCQFHTFVSDWEERYLNIFEGLERTHRMKWDYFPSGVAWERK